MWICLCKGVNDRQIRAAINAGARSPEEIAARCRAATGCGGCLPEVCRLLADHLAAENYFADSRQDLVPAGAASA
jgi:bacterioferritin-associated ferredoxin